jgi:hypothetical protein
MRPPSVALCKGTKYFEYCDTKLFFAGDFRFFGDGFFVFIYFLESNYITKLS